MRLLKMDPLTKQGPNVVKSACRLKNVNLVTATALSRVHRLVRTFENFIVTSLVADDRLITLHTGRTTTHTSRLRLLVEKFCIPRGT
jgi:hypothetical protein